MGRIGGYLFQFQTGSIKRKAIFTPVKWLLEFQFQTGSIKRQVEADNTIVQVSRFNSKLVRLKGIRSLTR